MPRVQDPYDDYEDEIEPEEDAEDGEVYFNVSVSKGDGKETLDFECATDGEVVEVRHVSYEYLDENEEVLGTSYTGRARAHHAELVP